MFWLLNPHVSVHHVCTVTEETRGCQISKSWSYRRGVSHHVSAGNGSSSPGKAAGDLSLCAISPALTSLFQRITVDDFQTDNLLNLVFPLMQQLVFLTFNTPRMKKKLTI